MVPVKNAHKLQISFQLPALTAYYKSKPADYLAHFLGHESTGSILATAKEKGWANALLAGENDDVENSSFSLFQVAISLTEKGVEMWKEVAALVFEYIGLLTATGCLQWAHEELQDIAAMDFRFSEEDDPDEIVSDIAEAMLDRHQFEREHILTGEHLITEYNPEIVTEILARMKPLNCRVEVVSKLVQSEPFVSSQSYLQEAKQRIEPRFGK